MAKKFKIKVTVGRKSTTQSFDTFLQASKFVTGATRLKARTKEKITIQRLR